MNRRHCLSAVALAALDLAACTSPSAPMPTNERGAMLSRTDLKADVDVLQRAYETLHPGLYRYNTPAQMREHFDALRASLDHDQSLAEAYLAFSIFAATVRCGHTYANFYNQTQAVRDVLLEGRRRVPAYFRWLGDRMIVTRNFSSDATLAPGTAIVAIDGIPAATILARLMTVARADGSNDAKRVAWLQVQGEDTIEAFDVFLPLLFPQIDAQQTLTVCGPGDAHTRRTTVAGLSHAQRLAARPEITEGDGPLWTLDTSSPMLAVLRMPTWALYNSGWDWKAFLQQSFETLNRQAPRALVIDLRGNEGGLDVGRVLLAHLVEPELRLPAYRRLVRYRKVPADLAPLLDTWDASFKDWGEAAQPVDARYFRLTKYDDDAQGDAVRPAAPRYAGRVFVLVGATNSSATFEFALQVQQARLGTLVGQPTGGNRRGINGGAFFFLRLPGSKIELDVPLIGQFPLTEQPDAGLVPDLWVQPSIDDIATGRDAEMAAVRRALAA